ncbi:hypothetical protein psyc5s11_36550 [Clostridium gelidum]|uniref:Uncharacterized protein n=1 Tax=Clostridium gelidum TaxID=704125 RepID=A0ABN6J2Z8_9CLOT|nr:hypothetical protein [Clostridium gelidum]BCZ47588.1 hypothetical protein psyc5s11_36550 [Clostridium gelidum]
MGSKLDVSVEKVKSGNTLTEFVENIAKKVFKNMFVLNTFIEGSIVEVLGTNKYSVRLINGETYELPSREGIVLSVGNTVLVAQVNGDINKRFIDCIKPY